MGESRISRFAKTFRTVIMSKYLMNSAVCLFVCYATRKQRMIYLSAL